MDPYADLRSRLERVLDQPELAVRHGVVGIAIRDADGAVVLDVLADRPLLPASTQKVVTAAAALRTFGADHRFETAVVGTGPIDAQGTLRGDLVLVAGGDPVLGTPGYGRYVYPVRPRTPLEELAVRVRTAGVRSVEGAVVADVGGFPGGTEARGWKTRYFWDFDARHITRLTVDAGLVVELTVPGASDDATEDTTEAAAPVTAAAAPTENVDGADGEQEPTRAPLTIPDGVVPDVRLEIAPEPALNAGRELQRLLAVRGIPTAAGVRASADPAPGDVLASVRSAPLTELLRHTVQRSDNQVADTLFRDVGFAVAGDGTWEGAASGVRRALDGLGLGWSGIVLADGSGLSREDRLTAGFLAELDAEMGGEFGETWWSLMAVAGREGTLRHRLRGTPAEGRFLGKTGTLDDVRAVVGTVLGPGGARYHLAVVGNDVVGADRDAVRRIMDELTLALVEDLHGCVRTPTAAASPDTATGEAASTLTCRVPLGPDAVAPGRRLAG